MQISRRKWLKCGAAAIGGLAVARSLPRRSVLAASIIGNTGMRADVTDASGRRHAAVDIFLNDGRPADVAISIDPAKTFQTILGFGSALTDAACHVLQGLEEAKRAELLHELFDADRMDLNICRLCIGASDYSTELFSYDEGEPDPDVKRFSIDHDRAAVIPVVQQVRKIKPELFLFGSPWSPPGWMKYGGSMKGGTIHEKYLGAYAQYIVNYLKAYEAAGVPVNAVTIQNEIDTDQAGRMPACPWPEEIEAAYISKHLGPLLAQPDLKTKIWILDHNYDLFGRVLDQLEKPEVRKYVDAVAWHGYAGTPDQMKRVTQAYPGIDMHWTEGGASYRSDDYLSDWSRWSGTFTEILRNGPRSIVTWNLALDENGRPNIGPFKCGGLVSIHSQTKEVTYSGLYWCLYHYANAFRRGTKVLSSSGGNSDLGHIAGRNPDGSIAVVLTNAGSKKMVSVGVEGRTIAAELPRDSVTTVRFSI